MKKSLSKIFVKTSNAWEAFREVEGWTLEYPEPAQFTRSQWDIYTDPSVAYLVYRTLVSSYMVSWWFIIFLNTGDDTLGNGYQWYQKGFFFIYLTNWSYTTLTVDCLIQTFMVADRYVSSRRGELHPPAMPRLWKGSWFLQNCSNALAVVISVVYWTLLHRQMGIPMGTNTVQVHLVNSIYVLTNMMISGHPMRLKHFFHPVVFGSVFLAFSLLYYSFNGHDSDGNPYIYPILDWRKPERTVLFVAPILIALILSHMFLFGVFKIRRVLHNRFGYHRVPIVVSSPNLSTFIPIERELTPISFDSRAMSPETDL